MPTNVAVRSLTVLVLFALAGAAAGVGWERWWTPPQGLTYDGVWYLQPAGPDVAFSGVALYVVIAFPVALVLAALVGVRRGNEAVMVGVVLVAATLAGVVMYLVGTRLGPADPHLLAAGVADYTPLPGELELTAPDEGLVPWRSTALLAWPSGAMAGLVGVYLFGGRGLPDRRRG